MYIYGKNPILFRLNNAKRINKIFLVDNFSDSAFLSALKIHKIPLEFISTKKMASLFEGNVNHQGVVAHIDDYNYYQLESIVSKLSNEQYPLIVILDGLEDPHNFGAIIRSAEASGVSAIIIPKNGSVEVNSTVYKVSTGAIDNVKIIKVTNITRSIEFLKKKGYWVVGLEGEGKTDYRAVDYLDKIVLVIGSEGKGISRLVKENCDYLVNLPMKGKTNSLNASNAAAIIFYHVLNCRNPL